MKEIIKKSFNTLVRCIISIPVLMFYSDLGVDGITIFIGFILMIWVILPSIEIIKLFIKGLNSH